jgi:hypothetical protein
VRKQPAVKPVIAARALNRIGGVRQSSVRKIGSWPVPQNARLKLISLGNYPLQNAQNPENNNDNHYGHY